ncbi:MAG: FlxA-like family protein [Pseudomonadota bacterium]
MGDISISLPRGISVSTAGAAGGGSNEIASLMKRIAQLQKDIKNRVADNSGDPRQKLEQLKLMQAELTLLNQTLARLLDQQARQGKRQGDKAAGLLAAAQQSNETPQAPRAVNTSPGQPAAQPVQAGQAGAPVGNTTPSVDTYA